MAQTANTQEPTMEEILASIRRIISEDGDEQKAPAAAAPAAAAPAAPAAKPAAAAAARPAPKAAPEPEIEDDEDEDVLELTDIVPEEEPLPAPMPPPRAKAPVRDDDVVMVPAERVAPARPRAAEEAQLISDHVRDQASSSFMQLARNVLVQETADPRSLEHLVQEMLRPMLQHWLNENLPSMVEVLVQQEIERVTRRERR
ncbi:MAG: DUF2497 domain-containing protein [Alphaproteobacteria bacterium]